MRSTTIELKLTKCVNTVNILTQLVLNVWNCVA